MVKICSEKYSDSDNEKYQAYFDIFPYSLSPFQKHAIEAIVEGNHVLVTAHTGSGKHFLRSLPFDILSDWGKRLFIRVLSKHFPIRNTMNLQINIRILNSDFLLEISRQILKQMFSL